MKTITIDEKDAAQAAHVLRLRAQEHREKHLGPVRGDEHDLAFDEAIHDVFDVHAADLGSQNFTPQQRFVAVYECSTDCVANAFQCWSDEEGVLGNRPHDRIRSGRSERCGDGDFGTRIDAIRDYAEQRCMLFVEFDQRNIDQVG